MKKFKTVAKVMAFVIIGYMFAVLQPTQAQQKQLRFGFIDSALIFEKYEGKKEVEDKYNTIILGWQEELRIMEEEIVELQQELEDCTMCSDAKRQELQQAISQRSKTAEEFYLQKFGYGGEASQLNIKMTNPILKEILQVVTEIGGSEDYTMIFDAVEGSIVYAPDELDMSQQVIDVLNSRPKKE